MLDSNHKIPVIDTSHIQRKWLDVAYAVQSPTQKLDIYLPPEGNGPFPVIMALHGGAWLMGDKRDTQQAPMLRGLEKGYAVVAINYRLSSEAIFPAQIHDCKAAVRWIRANARQYHLDPDHIAAWGASAGAHLASLVGTSAHIKELEDLSMGNPQESCRVQAVVDWCGPCENFLRMDEEFLARGEIQAADHSLADSPESRLLGKRITEIPEQVAAASPMRYITPSVPYFLIQHGDLDQIVPIEQSIRFYTSLVETVGPEKAIFEILHGVRHHGDPLYETSENVERIFAFLDNHLRR